MATGRLRRCLIIAWIPVGLSFTVWLCVGFQAVDVPAEAQRSDRDVVVTTVGHDMRFRPSGKPRNAGLIFLPGGMVDPIAYAPLLKGVAKAGYAAIIVTLPMRCGCTDSQVQQLFGRIRGIVSAEPSTHWMVAGHSRGGMLATRFVHADPAGLAGLVLIGTTHPRDFSLADLPMPVTKIYGTRDGVASYATMRRNARLLPPNTTWVKIEGGNHVQFGYYRYQLGDHDAAISRIEQQELVQAALVRDLSTVDTGAEIEAQ